MIKGDYVKKDNFLKGAFVATVCLVLTKVLGILYVIPFYNIIGSKGSVLYGCAYNIYAVFINLSTIGLPLAISKLVSEYNTLGYEDLRKRSYQMASRIMIITAVISSIILFVFAPNLAYFIIPDMSYGNTVNDIALVIRVCSTAIIFVTLISMIRGYLQGMKYIRASSYSQVIEQFVRVFVIIFGSYFYLKYVGKNMSIAVSIAVFGATLGAIVALMYLSYKKTKIPKVKNYKINSEEKKVTNKELLKKIITYTIPFIVMGLIGSSFELVDMFTVVRTLTKYNFSTETASVIMNIVTTLGSKLNVIITAIASGLVVSLLPNLTSDFVKKDMKEVRKKINRTLQIVIYITLPMAVGLSLLAVPVWNIFYGASEYGPKVFQVSIFIAVFSSISTNIIVVLQSLNLRKSLYISLFAGFVFNAIFNIPFMVWFEKVGLPIYYGNLVATMLGYALMIFLALFDLKKHFSVEYKDTLKELLITIIAIGVMSIVIIIMKQFIPIDHLGRITSIFGVGLYALVGALVYFVITYKTGSFNKIIGFKLRRKHENRNS